MTLPESYIKRSSVKNRLPRANLEDSSFRFTQSDMGHLFFRTDAVPRSVACKLKTDRDVCAPGCRQLRKFCSLKPVVALMLGWLITAVCLLPAQTAPADFPAPPPRPNSPFTVTVPLSDPVESLLADLTIPEKVGQLFMVFFNGQTMSPMLATHIITGHVGGLIIFAPNVDSPTQLRALSQQAQTLATTTGAEIPLFLAVDQESWPVARLNETNGFASLISNLAIGATHSELAARQMAEVIAADLQTAGLNMTLAPVLDVNNNPANPIIGWRSFGADPALVSRLGVAHIETYRAQGIIAVAKHFPGHGDTSLDSHIALPTIPHDRARLDTVELPPFRAAITASVPVMMTAHITFPAIESQPGLPATLSSAVLAELLRQELGFQGLIATDSLSMDAIDQTFSLTQATVMALEAGADLLMFGADRGHHPNESHQVYQHVLRLVETGVISESRLDESVRRILRLKRDYGLWPGEWSPATITASRSLTSPAASLDRRLVHQAITLIRDEADLWPLQATDRLLIIYPNFVAGVPTALSPYLVNGQLLPVDRRPSAEQIAQASRQAPAFDTVVILTANAWRYPAQAALVRAVVATDQPVMVVAVALPYDLPALPESTTYLATYGYSRLMLTGLAEVLFGLARPTGRLPVPLSEAYPVGFGLMSD